MRSGAFFGGSRTALNEDGSIGRAAGCFACTTPGPTDSGGHVALKSTGGTWQRGRPRSKAGATTWSARATGSRPTRWNCPSAATQTERWACSPGVALTTLIILLDIGAHTAWQPMPHKRAVRYGLGYKPWRAGVAELQHFGWLDLKAQPMAGAARVDHYLLHLNAIRGDSHLKHGWAPAWD